MDIPQTERYMAVSTVYLLNEHDKWNDETNILSVFANLEAANMAKKAYENRNFLNNRFRFSITEREVLDKTTISKIEGEEAPAVGEEFNS